MGPETQRSQLTHMRSPRSGWLSWGVSTQAGLQCPIPALLPQSAAQSLPAQSGANWSGGARLWIYKRSGQAWQPHAWGGGQLPASVSASTRAMAPGSIASSDTSTSSASLTSAVGSSGLSESEKPGPSHSGIRGPRRHPPVLRMVLEALQAGEQRRGTSVAAIKVYILQKYPTVDVLRLKYLLKQALATGMHRGLLVRPTNSKARGATGSFKLVPKHKRKAQSRKTSAMTAPRKPSEAKEKGPKKPREAKKDPPNPGEVKRGPKKPREARTGPTKLDAAKEKAPKKGSQTKDQEARLSEAKKASQQPDKATQDLPSATGPRGKSKVKGRRSNQDGEAHRKTKAGSQNSKSTVPKDKNSVASPAKKKENKVLKEVVACGAKVGPKAKATAPPRASGSKTVPAPLARKTGAPKGPRKPCMPTKASSSKLASKKTEAES
ncbi:histone H1.8 [Felis catus]|uniref:H15 domain-containing protein n=1 Tax=Felis catus TaxID=9685 RepID=A0ABI7X899_FELCA|nr:histone H1.8 [Felis catus]